MHIDGGPLSQSKPVHLPDSNSARVSRSHILWKFITLVMHVIHICLLLQRSLTRSYSSGIATGAHTSTSGSNGLHWYGGWGLLFFGGVFCFVFVFVFFFFFFFLGGGRSRQRRFMFSAAHDDFTAWKLFAAARAFARGNSNVI